MKKQWLSVACTLLASAHLSAENVNFESGFYAKVQRNINLAAETQAFTYEVLGATTVKTKSGKTLRFSFECLGFDEVGGKTKGLGRCQWRDKDDDKLFLALRTEGEENVYTVIGGSGKWKKASGSFRSSFVYLPAPTDSEFLGTESGHGQLNTAGK